MILQLNYTEQDYREGAAAVRSLGWLSLGMLPYFYLYLAFLCGIILGGILQRPAPGAQAKGAVDVCITTWPLMMVAAYWAFIVFRTRGRRSPHFIKPPTRLTRSGILLPAALVLITFVVTTVANALSTPTPPDTKPPLPLAQALRELALTFAPYLTLLVAMMLLVTRALRRSVTRMWELQGHLHETITMEIDESGITKRDSASQTRYLWPAFVGWHETPNLFLLYRSHVSFEMFPKRCFPTPPAAEYFFALIRRQLGESAQGFETLQPSPPQQSS